MQSITTPKHLMACALAAGLLAGLTAPANAADGDAAAPAKRKKLNGWAPVNTMVGGGGTLNKGTLNSALNMSFRDKDDIVENAGAGARTSKQLISVLKLRYAFTDNFEIQLNPGYVYNHRDAFGAQGSDHVQGPSDFKLAFNWGPWQEKQGDPLSLCLQAGVNMPTGQSGAKHPAGNDIWSYNAQAAITKVWDSRHRIDAVFAFSQPTQTGNQGVRKDTSLVFAGRYAYIFNEYFDAGLEFTVENVQDSERNGVSMNNGYTEMYVGPAVNFGLPKLKMWLGIGAYFPVVRDYDAPTATDDIRFDIKLGKAWSL